MTTAHASIDQHPDILALRASYDRAAESIAAQATFGLTLLTAIFVALSPHIVGFDAFTRLPDRGNNRRCSGNVLRLGRGSSSRPRPRA